MNPDAPGRALVLAKKIENSLKKTTIDVVIAPPFPFLALINPFLKKLKLGAQDVFWEDIGPYTGEVSWHQLKHLRVSHVIIGHAERRIYLGETDAMINKKISAVTKAGLISLFAVGEKEKTDFEKRKYYIDEQVRAGLKGISQNDFKKGVIVYEPVWAIGTGNNATPEDARVASNIIRDTLKKLWHQETVTTPILYGGSVNAKNALSFIHPEKGNMDGLLVGGASIDPKGFVAIIESASRKK